MDHHHTTRRAFLKAMPAAAVAVAVPAPSVAAEPATLRSLAERFRDEAMSVDPTIKGAWIGTDELTGPNQGRIFSVVLDRGEDARPKPAKPSPVARAIKAHKKAWREFGDSVNAADEIHPDYAGLDAVARWDRFSNAETRKLDRLLSLPATGADARDRAAYVYDMLRRNQTQLTEDQVMAFIRSSAGYL